MMLVLLAAQQASAAAPRSTAFVFVGLDVQSKAEQGAIEASVFERIRSGALSQLRVVEPYEGTNANTRDKAVDEATAKMAQGQKALDDLDSQKAVELFDDAATLLKSADLRVHFDAYVKALTLKAASHSVSGEQAEAKNDIVRLIALNPKVELPARYFSPDIVRFAEQQRKAKASAREPSDFKVHTEPPGALVWIDGVFRGVSPVTASGVAPGMHMLTVALSGFAFSQVEASTGSELVTLKPALHSGALLSARATISRSPNSAERDLAARQLGKVLGAEQVVLLLCKKSLASDGFDVTAERIAVADGHNFGYVSRSRVSKKDVAGVVEGVFEKDEPRRDGPVTHFEGADSWSTRKVAGFSLMGAGAALVATGVITGLQAQAAQREFEATPQTNTTISDNIKSRGRLFSVVADVSGILGIASLVTGGVLVFTGGKPSPPALDDGQNTALVPSSSKPEPPSAPERKAETSGTATDKSEPAMPSATPSEKLSPAEKKKRDDEEKQKKLKAEQEAFEREEAEAKAAEAAAKGGSKTNKKADPVSGKSAATPAAPEVPKSEPPKSEALKKEDGKKTPAVPPVPDAGSVSPERSAIERKADDAERKRRDEEERKKKAEKEKRRNSGEEDDLKNVECETANV
jgi:PEGA domain